MNEIKKIKLTQGKIALVDNEDYHELNKYKWYAVKMHESWYAQRTKKRKTILMHHQITGFKHELLDHADRNGLNNQKENLRRCNRSQNAKNHNLQKNNTSGFNGVCYHKDAKKWMAYIRKDQVLINLGLFHKKTDAGRAVDKKATELFGEFAVLNFPEKKGGDIHTNR